MGCWLAPTLLSSRRLESGWFFFWVFAILFRTVWLQLPAVGVVWHRILLKLRVELGILLVLIGRLGGLRVVFLVFFVEPSQLVFVEQRPELSVRVFRFQLAV